MNASMLILSHGFCLFKGNEHSVCGFMTCTKGRWASDGEITWEFGWEGLPIPFGDGCAGRPFPSISASCPMKHSWSEESPFASIKGMLLCVGIRALESNDYYRGVILTSFFALINCFYSLFFLGCWQSHIISSKLMRTGLRYPSEHKGHLKS
jgi:hypothetical protein